jgi:hypothetical protein
MSDSLMILVAVFFIFYIIYDSYKVIINKTYKTTWIILLVNLGMIPISIYGIYTIYYPMHTLNIRLLNFNNRLAIILTLLMVLSAFLKSNNFKR